MKSCIFGYLNSKYLLDMAWLIDPRFKATYIPDEKIEALKHRAVSEAVCLLADQSRCQSDPAVFTVPEPEDMEAMPSTSKKKSLASFLKQITATSTTLTQRQAVENELSSYLLSVTINSDANSLLWWKEHEMIYPALSNLAKTYLVMPATSSPSEQVFSCSGNIVTCYRASLKPEAVDRLVFPHTEPRKYKRLNTTLLPQYCQRM